MPKRDRRVEVRLTQEEYNKLEKKAQRAHMSVGASSAVAWITCRYGKALRRMFLSCCVRCARTVYC